jgi:maleylacetoacetate isomerase
MVRRLALMVVADIQPIQNMKVLQYVGDEKKMAWAQHWISEGFKVCVVLYDIHVCLYLCK